MDELEVGDVVRLTSNSDNHRMTVEYIIPPDTNECKKNDIRCVWFDHNDSVCRDIFPRANLELL